MHLNVVILLQRDNKERGWEGREGEEGERGREEEGRELDRKIGREERESERGREREREIKGYTAPPCVLTKTCCLCLFTVSLVGELCLVQRRHQLNDPCTTYFHMHMCTALYTVPAKLPYTHVYKPQHSKHMCMWGVGV